MESFYNRPIINSDENALLFFKRAIKYRNDHKDESREIARFVFDCTHQLTIGIKLDVNVDGLRAEFIALEAPGMPLDDNLSPEEYDDYLWNRLALMIDLVIEKRTV